LVYYILKNYDAAISMFQEAIRLDPTYAGPQISLAGIHRKLGSQEDYRRQIGQARFLMAGEKPYTQARFEAVCGHIENTLIWLNKTLTKTPGYHKTIQNAADFDFFRDDPRFKQLGNRQPKVGKST
jgi:tetratricopeptide (TPR) repeat protein